MKAIFFDLDDTLYDQMGPFTRAYQVVFPSIQEISIMELFKRSREYSDKVFTQTESGEIPLERMHEYRIVHAFRDLGHEISSEEALRFQTIYRDAQYTISLLPEIKKILDYLSGKNIPTHVLTNGPSSHQWAKIQALKLLDWIPESHIFISSDIGYAKPQKEIFHYVNNQTNTTSSNSFMVGDSFENDIIGAHGSNWNHIWFNPKNRKIPDKNYTPHYEVTSYQDLEKLIINIF